MRHLIATLLKTSACLFLPALLLVGCAGGDAEPSSEPSTETALREVRFDDGSGTLRAVGYLDLSTGQLVLKSAAFGMGDADTLNLQTSSFRSAVLLSNKLNTV